MLGYERGPGWFREDPEVNGWPPFLAGGLLQWIAGGKDVWYVCDDTTDRASIDEVERFVDWVKENGVLVARCSETGPCSREHHVYCVGEMGAEGTLVLLGFGAGLTDAAYPVDD